MTRIGQEEIRALLHYDPDTGVLTRRTTQGPQHAGSVAGNLGNHGYLQLALRSKMYLAHRVIWMHVTGAWPPHQIDHINRVKTDNRWPNLRLARPSQNIANIGVRSHNRSGRKGVSWSAKRRKWCAFIQAEGRQTYLGSFDDRDEAHAAYIKAARALFGEFFAGEAA